MAEKRTRKPRTVATKEVTTIAVTPKELPAQQQKESASIETFITQAIANNVPIETMERLLAMRKELKAEHAKEAFIVAIAQFQAECPVIVKDTIVKDKYGKERYRYAALDSIVKQVKESLGRNGLSYAIDIKNGDSFITATTTITHILGHSQSSSFEAPIDKDAYMSAPQKYGAASTFAKRYSFSNALGILTGDMDTDAADLEGGAAHEPEAPKKGLPLDNPVVLDYKRKLESAKTLLELGNIWSDMPGEVKLVLAKTKDQMKAIITSATQDENHGV